MFRSALRMSLAKAPMANGPLQAPTNLNQLHARNFARVQSKSWIGAMTVGLVWLWMVRIPNSELCFDYRQLKKLEKVEKIKKVKSTQFWC